MKKFSKVLALGLIATVVGGTFAGCGTKTEPTPTPATSEAPVASQTPASEAPTAPVTLRTVGMFGGTDPKAATYDQGIKDFMAANSNITVEDESATADEQWKASVVTDFAADNEPDVINFFTDVTSKTLVEEGKVVSVDEIKAAYPDYGKDISPAALASAAYAGDGKNYALPVQGYYEGLYCNKDLFEQNGIELPTDWAKFEAAIKGFAAKGITPIAVSLNHIPHYWIEHLILAEGGVKEHSNKDVAAVKDTWVNGLSYFKKFNDMGAFPKDATTSKHELQTAAFADKKAAMFLDGSWAIGQMKDADNTVLLPMPSTGNGKKDPTELIAGFSSGFYITKKAWDDPAKRDAAVKFVEYMTSKEMIKGFIGAGGGAPAADIGEITGVSPLAASGAKMSGEAKGVDSAIDGWLPKPAWDYLTSKIPGIATGKEDVKAVVDKVIELNK